MSKNGEFPDKWLKKLPTGWSEGAESMKDDELKEVIVKSRRLMADLEKDMENDDKLKVLKDDIKLLVSAYRETQTAEDAKIRLACHLLKERGVKV